MQTLSAPELKAWLERAAQGTEAAPLVLDVREPWEIERASLAGSHNIPMQQIPARLAEIDDERAVVCLCHHGARSMQVAQFLERQGVSQVFNLTGGIDAWSALVDPQVPRY